MVLGDLPRNMMSSLHSINCRDYLLHLLLLLLRFCGLVCCGVFLCLCCMCSACQLEALQLGESCQIPGADAEVC